MIPIHLKEFEPLTEEDVSILDSHFGNPNGPYDLELRKDVKRLIADWYRRGAEIDRLSHLHEHFKKRAEQLDTPHPGDEEGLVALAIEVSNQFQTAVTKSAFAAFAGLFLAYRAECEKLKEQNEELVGDITALRTVTAALKELPHNLLCRDECGACEVCDFWQTFAASETEGERMNEADDASLCIGMELVSVVSPCGLHVIGYRVRDYARKREEFRTFPGPEEGDRVQMMSVESLIINGAPAPGTVIDFPMIGMGIFGITEGDIVAEIARHKR